MSFLNKLDPLTSLLTKNPQQIVNELGFGGQGHESAADLAADQQRKQQAQIDQNVNQINSAFDNRGTEYAKYKNALQDQYQQELDRQQGIAARQSKFAIARSGLSGGSAATDAGQLLGQQLAQGTLNAQQQVESGVSKLQAADQATKQQLISLAETGANIGNASTQASEGLQANLGTAMANNAAQGLGDVFAATTSAYNNEQQAAALRSGILKGSLYAASPLGTTKMPGT